MTTQSSPLTFFIAFSYISVADSGRKPVVARTFGKTLFELNLSECFVKLSLFNLREGEVGRGQPAPYAPLAFIDQRERRAHL
jgi:hypothetical protein